MTIYIGDILLKFGYFYWPFKQGLPWHRKVEWPRELFYKRKKSIYDGIVMWTQQDYLSLCPGLGEESLSLAGVGATLFLMQKVLPNGLRQDQLGKSKDNLITTNTLKNWLESGKNYLIRSLITNVISFNGSKFKLLAFY